VETLAQYIPILVSQLSMWETGAVSLAIAYLLLATRENIICWYCAFVSTVIYTALFWQVSLLMESALNIYYMGMAVYGWHQWRSGGQGHRGAVIRTLCRRRHLQILMLIATLTVISGYALSNTTQAAWPYVDSFTTWASVITTIMVAKKILENWLYWFVIDSVSIPLYIERGLHLTAFLFAAYLVVVVIGYLTWHKHYIEDGNTRHEI